MLQVYTGDGKGKTTAAVGLAMRSLGAGHRVYFAQFMKGLAYSEQDILKKFAPQLILQTTGKPYFIAKEGMLTDEQIRAWGDMLRVYPPGHPPADYVELAAQLLNDAKRQLDAEKFDLVILDEVNMALFYELLTREQLEAFLDAVPADTEIVCTGRRAPDWLCQRADLITEMKEIKHYFKQGVKARKGIEN